MQFRITSMPGILMAFMLAMMIISFASFCPAASDDPIVATVNGIEIRKSQLDRVVAEYKKNSRKQQVTSKDKLELLKSIIRRQLILQQPVIKDLREDANIVARVKAYEDQLVVANYLEKKVGRLTHVTPEEIKEYYKKNLQRFKAPPKVKASHILLRNRKDAEMVLARLQGGEDFAQLAKQFSIDLPMAFEGGSMGVIEKGKSLPALEKELFLLHEGEFSKIVETQYGHHILRVDEIITEPYRPLEEVRKQIRQTLYQQKEAQAFEEMVVELERNADIKILDAQLVGSVLEETQNYSNLTRTNN